MAVFYQPELLSGRPGKINYPTLGMGAAIINFYLN